MTERRLGRMHANWLERRRGISADLASRFGLYTGRSGGDGVVPDEGGDVLVFPFTEQGREIGAKFRGPEKRFWQTSGGVGSFWNADVLDDPALQEGRAVLVICEGEIDALTAIQCGWPHAVSVPDGAPHVPEDADPEAVDAPLDPEADASGKFKFMFRHRAAMRQAKRFVLAVDADRPGARLRAELVRRLGAARCSFVTYPEGCKDLNDVLTRHGPEAVAAVLNGAKPFPVRGLYELRDYPPKPQRVLYGAGWPTLHASMKLFPGEFMVVTGIPSHGKTTWALNLIFNLGISYGWKSAVTSFEAEVVPELRDKLRRIIMSMAREDMVDEDRAAADAWISEHLVFIDHAPDPTAEEEDITLEWLLDRAADAVMRFGIRVLLIDPWNELEHARRRDETETQYIARAIRALKRFAKRFEVLVIVVAHPTKEVGRDGEARVPTLYDIEGSASWFNKADLGVTIHVDDPDAGRTDIHVKKVRFDGTGRKGVVPLAFNADTARFSDVSDER